MSVLLTVGLLICLMFCGLSLDIGLLELRRTQLQTAADAAAIAGDMYFERTPAPDGSVGTEAAAAAAQYGFVNGANGAKVTALVSLSKAAVGGDYAGHYDTIQVTITQQMQTLFMGLLNSGTVTVTATGTASPPPCEYFLGTKNLATYTVNLQNPSGTAQWYSKCSAYIEGGLSSQSGSWWQAFQTYFTGPASASSLLGRTKEGTTFNAAVITDPLASIAQPSAGTCVATNYTHGSLASATTITLNPGTYCGSVNSGVVTPGMTLLNVNVTFNPGLYVITGGVNWQEPDVTANGVTFFFTNVSSTSSYGTVAISGTDSVMNMSAPTGTAFGKANGNGTLAGLLFFFDRNWVNTGAQDFTIQIPGGYFTFSGVWYLPSTGLGLLNGQGECTVYCAVVADNLYLSSFVNNLYGTDYTQYPGDNPLRRTSVLVQ